MRPAAATASSALSRGGRQLLRNRGAHPAVATASVFVAPPNVASYSAIPCAPSPTVAPAAFIVPSPSPMSTPSTRGRPFHSASALGKELPPDAYTGIEIRASVEAKGKELEGTNIERALEALANADAVCFDVDSTVIMEEGIDVLADYLGKGKEVAAWTRKAMEGDTKFEDALAARLDIIRPSRASIENCLRDHPLRLSPNVDVLIEKLNEKGTDVYLVSGGFRLMIEPLAMELCVSKTNIVANTILFDDDGNYSGFCSNEPTSRDMGKPAALRALKEEHGYDTMVMVGDGATDLQAVPPADAFVGFGGVAVRDAVREKACWFVTDFEDVVEVVDKFGMAKLLPGS
uniref:phosphoserine phosphatase n=2 Tax=Odontella aurita TaxID=265563 RepID=A0A7S4HLU8_9STRA|mmetsp:Transcript_12107/g.35356  ORF Transcript_12107/g.35356 Transcript_12107/m.35356 type:complete len:346 (+) Transcript_12107:62-1099(+)